MPFLWRAGRRAVTVAAVVVALTACDAEPASRSAPATPTPSGTPSSEPAAPAPPAETTPPDWLLPNMRSIAAFDLQVEGSGAARRLRFAASLANVGIGPLLVVPRGRAGCPRGQIRVRQVVHLDANGDRRFQRRRDVERRRLPGGCMLDHPTHDHWHFDAMAAYELHVPGTRIRSARNKVSFCLRDNRRAPGAARVVRRAYFGDCSATTPQGISPGWVDVYGADLDGQALRLPRRAEGRRACLTLTADPLGLLRETDEADNATSIPIRIVGQRVRRLAGTCRPAP